MIAFVFFLSRIASCVWYTVVPYHCVRHGISLFHVGAVATAAQAVRMLVPAVAVRTGVPLWKLKLPLAVLPMLSGAANLVVPPDAAAYEAVLLLHLLLLIVFTARPPEKAIAARVWRASVGADKASAAHEALVAFGYSGASFVGVRADFSPTPFV
jgi:hypothetical protein